MDAKSLNKSGDFILASIDKSHLLEEINSVGINTQAINEVINNRSVLLACSGGVDSLALLVILHSLSVDFSVCYVEHGLSKETKAAGVMLDQLCLSLKVDFKEVEIDLPEEQRNSNVEANARNLRYKVLEQTRLETNKDVLATAHHMDDVAETFLINLIRGTGSGGFSLAQERNRIVRPILSARKKQLESVVAYCSLLPVVDPTNSEPIFVRNRIRNEVIPLLDEISNRDTTTLIVRAAEAINSDAKYIRELAISKWPKGEPTTKSLRDLDPALQIHALREWIEGYPPSTEEMERILKVVSHEIKSTQLSGHRTIRRTGGVLYQDITEDLIKVDDDR